MKAVNMVSNRHFSRELLLIFLSLLSFVSTCQNFPAQERKYNGTYKGDYLNHIAFPLGGIGAGMICIEGTGTISHVSIRNKPDIFNEPIVFSAISIKGDKPIARVLEGPVPKWKYFGCPGTGKGSIGKTYGLPRFARAAFKAHFPFATVTLEDPNVPLQVQITAWSPFIPLDADDSSLPVAALEYRFINSTNQPIEAVYSFNSQNFMAVGDGNDTVREIKDGFILAQRGSEKEPWQQGEFAALVDSADAKVNCAWFRGGWFDALTIAWKDVAECACYKKPSITEGKPSPGGSIFVPMKLAAHDEKTIRLMLCWYVPKTNLRLGEDRHNNKYCLSDVNCLQKHAPWYAGKFKSIESIANYWRHNYMGLRDKSSKFSDCFYDTTLPDEVIEAVAANLTILKSPTVLRQIDGRLWCFEGCYDDSGCCPGSCTHVWNYAQAIPHLFPELERTLRQTEFNECQDEKGHQIFRAPLPIRQTEHNFHSASDGQLGGIMKVYRDWRISGDTEWLKQLWPKVKASLNYCIETWDPEHTGVLFKPHHNTYDIEFWGPDSMCSSFYLGAIKAASKMGKALNDEVPLYASLLRKGEKYLHEQLFNGEYFFQKIQWKGLRAKSPLEVKSLVVKNYSAEAIELLEKEGPIYQYGVGCLSDGVIGDWMARVCEVGPVLDAEKVKNHLQSVYKHNLRKDLSEHANPQRPGYALGNEGGLILCTWPKGRTPTLPFIYSNEVWTGVEYQVVSHMMMNGMVEEGLEIIRTCRNRYDGRFRNPFDEYECGHWYARAMSSYALLQGLTGARFDAVEKVLYLRPGFKGDFRSFLCTATGYGTLGLKNGKPFIEVKQGNIPVKRIEYSAD